MKLKLIQEVYVLLLKYLNNTPHASSPLGHHPSLLISFPIYLRSLSHPRLFLIPFFSCQPPLIPLHITIIRWRTQHTSVLGTSPPLVHHQTSTTWTTIVIVRPLFESMILYLRSHVQPSCSLLHRCIGVWTHRIIFTSNPSQNLF
jgi:hypothetical protein